jgi:hypothetical protein
VLAQEGQAHAHGLVGDDRMPAVVEERDRLGRGVEDRAGDRVAPAQLPQNDGLGERDRGLVGEVRDELDVAPLERHVGEPPEAEHPEHLPRLQQRDVQLMGDPRHAGDRAHLEAVGAVRDVDRALLDGGAAGEPVAGQEDLGRLARVEAARGREREVAAAPRVAHVEHPGLAGRGVRDAVEDQVRERREPCLGGDRLAEGARDLHARLLGVERAHGALELAALGLELLGVGGQLAALGLELVVGGLERLGHLVERPRHRRELAAAVLGAADARRPVPAGEPPGGGRHAPHRHDDRAPDVDAVERVQQPREQQPGEAERDGAADRRARVALAARGVGAQARADRRELLADVVDSPLALARGDEAPRRGQRAVGRPDLGGHPVGQVRVDVRRERVEDHLLVAAEPSADDALLLGDVALGGERRLEELAPAGDDVAAHAGLGVDDVALEVGDRLRGGEDVVRLAVRPVGGAHGADEQREHEGLEQREDDRGDHDLARERAGVRGRAGAHRGRS